MPVSQVFDRALQLALQLDLFSDLVTPAQIKTRGNTANPLAQEPVPASVPVTPLILPTLPVSPVSSVPPVNPAEVQKPAPDTGSDTVRPDVRLRHCRCGDQMISYTLSRSSRRSIGLSVRDSQLHITAPHRVTISTVEEAIIAKQRWIRNKIQEQQNRPSARQRSAQQWSDGASLPFMGSALQLGFDPDRKRIGLASAQRLELPATVQSDEGRIRMLVEGWLKQQALQIFEFGFQHAAIDKLQQADTLLARADKHRPQRGSKAMNQNHRQFARLARAMPEHFFVGVAKAT